MSARPPLSVRGVVGAIAWPLFKIFGFLSYLAMRALEPWCLVRVGYLENDRIGHQAINTEMFLRFRALEETKKLRLDLLVSGAPANQQLHGMIRRRLRVLRLPLLGLFYKTGLRPLISGGRFEADMDLHHYDFDLCAKARPQLAFNSEEDRRGRALLESLGVPAGAQFFCFHARSSAFLDARHPHHSREQWSYHDYRDCTIENYLPAAEHLAEQGLYALRMGTPVDAPIKSPHPRVIDYATRHRSDFGDVYLSGRCKFFLGNTAGLVCVPWTFGAPVLLANMIPIYTSRPFNASDLALPKTAWDAEKGRLLSFREMKESANWNEADRYVEAGVELRENSPEDLLDAAVELNARLDGTWTPQAGDEDLQRRFQDLLPRDHRERGSAYRLAAGFLRRNQELLN